jgi:hypothetical protein
MMSSCERVKSVFPNFFCRRPSSSLQEDRGTTATHAFYHDNFLNVLANVTFSCEISSSHGGEYDVQSCLLGCTAV